MGIKGVEMATEIATAMGILSLGVNRIRLLSPFRLVVLVSRHLEMEMEKVMAMAVRMEMGTSQETVGTEMNNPARITTETITGMATPILLV
jgi:hypothetical protein